MTVREGNASITCLSGGPVSQRSLLLNEVRLIDLRFFSSKSIEPSGSGRFLLLLCPTRLETPVTTRAARDSGGRAQHSMGPLQKGRAPQIFRLHNFQVAGPAKWHYKP